MTLIETSAHKKLDDQNWRTHHVLSLLVVEFYQSYCWFTASSLTLLQILNDRNGLTHDHTLKKHTFAHLTQLNLTYTGCLLRSAAKLKALLWNDSDVSKIWLQLAAKDWRGPVSTIVFNRILFCCFFFYIIISNLPNSRHSVT